jgi:small subunit ribosomal protein S8
MLQEGYIKDIEEYTDGSVNMIRFSMKYGKNKERVITGLKRISKPGLRVYCRKEEIPKVLNGLGIAVISTSKGVVTDKEARKLGVGGEVLCYIW